MKRSAIYPISVLLIFLILLSAVAAADNSAPAVLTVTAERAAARLSARITFPELNGEGILLCAVYDADGKMLENVPLPVTFPSEPTAVYFQIDAGEADTVKAFLLNAETWAPLCGSAENQVPDLAPPGDDETEELPLW